MIRAGVLAVAVAAALSAQAGEAPPLDLPALVPAAVPEGFEALPDQPGRLGLLDVAAAAAVLDRSGQTPPERLAEAGFRQGYSRAWTKRETQEVILDVLLEFSGDRAAAGFAAGVAESRRHLQSFEVEGIPAAVGFQRGPAAPTSADPAQREVVLRHGRVVAIVVIAGHLSQPDAASLAAVVAAQWERLQVVPVEPTPDGEADDRTRLLWGVTAQALLAVVLWRTVVALSRTRGPLLSR